MHNQFKQETTFFGAGSFGAVFSCILFLTIISMPQYWKNIIYERSALTWVESLLLFSCSLLSLFNLLLKRVRTGKLQAVWILLSVAFLYLAIDERFMLHEAIREKVLKPNHIYLNFLFWIEKGDYVLIAFMVIGLSLLPLVLNEIKSSRKAFLFFIAGILCSALAVGADTIDLHGLNLPVQYSIQYIEEILETGGMLCFLNSFAAKFFESLNDIALGHAIRK